MADLTRLSAIAVSTDSVAPVCAAMLYYVGEVTERHNYASALEVQSALRWIASSPMLSLGEYLNSAALSYLRKVLGNLELNAAVCDEISYYLTHFGEEEVYYTKSSRLSHVSDLVTHAQIQDGDVTVSPVETAILDSVTAVGYSSVSDALSALSRLTIAEVIDKPTIVTRQRSRAVFTAYTVVREPSGDERFVITPPCVSRQSAKVALAVYCAATHREVLTNIIQQRAFTVTSLAARIDLQRVRDIVEPATQLITNYRFDPISLTLSDALGRVRERATSRNPAATVAFALLTSRGATDILMEQARARVDLVPDTSELIAPIADYYENATDTYSMLMLFLRGLEIARVDRIQSGRNHDVNKGPCLGYVPAARRKSERNTAAALNRLAEVAVTARSFDQAVSRPLVIFEWVGTYSREAVIAAAAMMKLDIAIDMGASGVDIGGTAVPDKASKQRHFTAVLSAIPNRNLPVCSTIPYEPDASVTARLNAVIDAVGTHNDGYVYIYGGSASNKEISHAATLDEARARLYAVNSGTVKLANLLSTTDVLMPPVCYHWQAAGVDAMLDTYGLVVDGCETCKQTVNAIRVLTELINRPGVRLVKTRSAFGHNAHFDIETSSHIRDSISDSAVTIDSAAFMNHLRNCKWEGEVYLPGGAVAAGEQYTAEVDEGFHSVMMGVRMHMYSLMAGTTHEAGPLHASEFDGVARSLS
nr:MAG: hypothetical protein [Aspergillus flavus polymycovirus 1]